MMSNTKETNIEENYENKDNQNDNEPYSRLNEIIEHIQKPKKLVLPKGYLRPRNTQIDNLDIQDNLSVEHISNNKNNIVQTDKKDAIPKPMVINILEPSEDAKKKNKNTKDNKEKKTRNPTAYNIYVKETVVKLQESHKDLTPKERFKLAISMWSENKPTRNEK